MIDIFWGEPLFLVSRNGESQSFRTLEKAQHWLQRRWPTNDETRRIALDSIDAALDCLVSPKAARDAFVAAAVAAGFCVTPMPVTHAHSVPDRRAA
ncbi:DUF982 domain-containing protein [Pararhodobacter marinus]|uniref:DUF982 domain-containing protein n=1 Tax=Pararhodobacter marinus TaxID=2184063 RepID=UPI0035197A8D